MTQAEKAKDIARQFRIELSMNLAAKGFSVRSEKIDQVTVYDEDALLCHVNGNGVIQYPDDAEFTEAQRERLEQVIKLARTTLEYTQAMESAPPLKAEGLEDGYYKLAEFNNVVLAGHSTAYGMQFITWEWTYDKTGLWQGHYYNDYGAAKLNFATRCGMLSAHYIFSPQQYAEIYRFCTAALEEGMMDRERERSIDGIRFHIENIIPNIQEQIAAMEPSPPAIEQILQ